MVEPGGWGSGGGVLVRGMSEGGDENSNIECCLRSLPSLCSFKTPLWPCHATSAIQMPRMLTPFWRHACNKSSHNGSYSS